jgi:glycosyltransferase involved in cell wall biosynthesis
LFKGGGPSSKNEKAIWNLPRDGKAAKFLGRITGRGNYFIEQCTFMLALIPRIARLRPQVIFFSDAPTGNLLYRWRRLSKQRYSILLCNGGPAGPPFPKCDHIQEVTQPRYQVALGVGEPATKFSMVPLGINAKTSLMPASSYEKAKLREQINLPVDRPIIICVGAINKLHKRMDYLISEVANLPQPRPFLLILGQQEEETPAVLEMANQKLGPENFTLKTVPWSEIPSYYRASDLFVLTSKREGFGRVFLEALSHGLPCLAHDYDVAHYVLGKSGYFADFQEPGNLTALIQRVLPHTGDEAKKRARQQDIYDRFSWDKLRPQYVEMLRRTGSVHS